MKGDKQFMKQSDNKQVKKKRAARLRKMVSIIGGTIGFAIVLYKVISKRKKQQPIHTNIYIPIGSSTNLNEEIAVTKEICHLDDAAEYVEEQEQVFEQLIQDILHNELLNAKKVWVTNSCQEEMQIEKHIFEEKGHLLLGNSEKNIKLQDVYKLKYRNKIYFDRDFIN